MRAKRLFRGAFTKANAAPEDGLPKMIGDWMGSEYDMTGCRRDTNLFLDRDGRYERQRRSESGYAQSDAGRWEHDTTENTLRLTPDTASENDFYEYWVLSVERCERSNVILVLRPAILASRNLPMILYRVHTDKDRGYGTDWKKQLPS
jgi:hypothetical protein